MRRLMLAAALMASATAASATLTTGTKAPDFTTTGALAGKPFTLHLADQLKKGPVVLYFFPKAFTQGCTLEAHAFSEAEAEFKAAGAQVIGMSADDQPTLAKFSVEECRNSFPVATATPAVTGAYDVAIGMRPGMPAAMAALTSRTSYVIGRDGKVAYVHSDMDWRNHVANTLAAVKALH